MKNWLYQVTDLVPVQKFGKLQVYQANQLPRSGMLLLLYGASGIGKTTLCATAPGRKAFLDYDRRTNVLAHMDNIEILKANVYEDAMDFFNDDPARNWDIMVLDNASELAQIQKEKYSKNQDMKDPRQQYNAVQVDMIRLFKKCRDYAAETGTCIIWNAWESKVLILNEGIAAERVAPDFAPALANNLLGLAQFVGYLAKEGGIRELVFESEKLPVKWGVAPNDVAAKIPKKIKNPSLDPILRTLIGGEPYHP